MRNSIFKLNIWVFVIGLLALSAVPSTAHWRTFGGTNAQTWITSLMASCLDGIVIGIGRTVNEGSATVDAVDGATVLLDNAPLSLQTQTQTFNYGSSTFPFFAFYQLDWPTPFAAPGGAIIEYVVSGTGAGGSTFEAPINNCTLGQTYMGMPGWESLSGYSKLTFPDAVAVDPVNGFVYVLDNGSRIQKFDTDGNFLMQWGNYAIFESTAEPGDLGSAEDIAVDSGGNVYIADALLHRVTKFDGMGNYITHWGTFGLDGSGDGQFNGPAAIDIDSSDNVFVGDAGRHDVQKFTSSGVFLNKFGSYGSSNGQFDVITALAVHPGTNDVFVGDLNNQRVSRFDNDGNLLNLWSTFGVGDTFSVISDIDVDSNGNVFVTDSAKHRVTYFNVMGILQSTFGTNGAGNGQLDGPEAIAVGASDHLFVADRFNNRIQKFTSPGVFSLQWGQLGSSPRQFEQPLGIDESASGFFFVADSVNNRIQKLDDNGGFVLEWGTSGTNDGEFNTPSGLATGSSGRVYVVDQNNNRVQFFDENGLFLGKWGTLGTGNGQFDQPCAIDTDRSGNVYVVDRNNHRVQVFDPDGNYQRQFGANGAGDGQFSFPCGVTVHRDGSVYVSDTGNHRIQRFDSSGVYLNQRGTFGTGDLQFNGPEGLALDELGNLYIVDSGNNRIQKLDSAGNYVTEMNQLDAFDSPQAAQLFNAPTDIVVDGDGIWYVTDTSNNRVAIIRNLLSPIAQDDSYAVNFNAPSVVSAPGVLTNDSDYFSDPLQASAVVQTPLHGNVTLNADGSFTYTPNNGFVGLDFFTYSAVDGTAFTTNTAVVAVNVPNPPPTAADDSYSTAFNTALVVNAANGVIANDDDPNGDPLTASVVSQPANGTLSLSADGSFTYTPNNFFVGSDSFTYVVSDGVSNSSAAMATTSVEPPTQPPTSTNDSYTTAFNAPLTVVAANGVLANDSDPNGIPLTAALVSATTKGVLALGSDGSFTYTPNHAYVGNDSFTYMAETSFANSNVATVTINVEAPTPATDLSLVAPTGELTDSVGNPTYEWIAVNGATEYSLYLAPEDNLSVPRFFGDINAADICTNNICSVDLTTITPTAWLENNTFVVYMSSTNWNTYAGPFEFEINSPRPATVTPGPVTGTIGTLKPIFTWTLEGTAVHSSYYQLYVAPTDDIANSAFFGWVSREDVCDSWASTTCMFQLPQNLQDKTHYTAYMFSWGPGGTSSGGVMNTGWVGPIEFNMGGPLPNVPSGIQASVNGSQVTITFNDDANATAFSFWIGQLSAPEDAYYQKHNKGADGLSCNGTTCTFTPSTNFTSGQYRIYMQAEGPGGTSRGGIALGWGGDVLFLIP